MPVRLFPANAPVYSEVQRCAAPHAHTILSPQDDRFVTLRSLQNKELQAGVVVFFDPDRGALRPFCGIFVHQVKQDYREVSPRSYDTQFSRYPDLRRIHCHCALDSTIPREASEVRWLKDHRGSFYAACHTGDATKGCGMEVPLLYYKSPSKGKKNIVPFKPSDSLIIEEHQRAPSEASLGESARSRSSSISSYRSAASSAGSQHTAPPRAPFARAGGSAVAAAPVEPVASRPPPRGLLSQELHAEAGPSRKRARSASPAAAGPAQGVGDGAGGSVTKRQARRDRVVDLVYAASNPTLGIAPGDSRELLDLVVTEHCDKCNKY